MGSRGRRVLVALRVRPLDILLRDLGRLARALHGRGQPLPLRLRRLELDAQPAEPLAVRGERRIELAQGAERGRGFRLRDLEGAALLGERESRALDRGAHGAQPLGGGVAFGDQFEPGALCAGSPRAARTR